MAHETPLRLPVLVSSPTDIGRLIRELESLDEVMLQQGLRHGKDLKLPKTSLLLEKTAEQNKLNLLHETDRKHLLQFLNETKEKAPVLHISFSADPSASFMEKMVTWLRQEIHPHVLVTVGLQPGLGAGCIVRGSSKQFDFSLRRHFNDKRDLLLAALLKARKAEA